jgi:hypothetical protein
MKRTARLGLVAALALAAPLAAQEVGSKMGPVNLQGFAQTEAKTFDNFLGNVVLLEFFAYW